MRAIITGAASGIGRAAAIRLATDGAKRAEPAQLVLVDLHKDALQIVAADLKAQGARAETLAGDVADEVTARTAAGMAEQHYGGLDALVSNAGRLIQATPHGDRSGRGRGAPLP